MAAEDRPGESRDASHLDTDNTSEEPIANEKSSGSTNSDENGGPLGLHSHHIHEYSRRKSSVAAGSMRPYSDPNNISKPRPARKPWWDLRSDTRGQDGADERWWFASTAIPLISAAIGPLANVLSIAALVTSWRSCLIPGADTYDAAASCVWDEKAMLAANSTLLPELQGTEFTDPIWCLRLNVISLVFGFVGNFFLLCNFTSRIRYIVALPATIICWYIATGILTGITIGMAVWTPPHGPEQTYTQGFWYAVIASCMYMICAMLLMVNMAGYFLGHYPQQFNLTDSQKTLILQTMLFFIWLAGGAGVFFRVETDLGGAGSSEDIIWSYVNALYFCDVTILTVGFGDVYPSTDLGRGLVFPYSVGGIIMLGLIVSSISRFAKELGSQNVVRRHIENNRIKTIERTLTTERELSRENTFSNDKDKSGALKRDASDETLGGRPAISAPFAPKSRSTTISFAGVKVPDDPLPPANAIQTLQRVATMAMRPRKPRLLLLREEKDRFDAMRRIQASTAHFKTWFALCMSVMSFGVLWCVGAAVFWQAEKETQGMTYFQALYFCYVSLLTIGYGDLAPKSNAGRPFFVFWSLIAIPVMSILVGDLGDTVINRFKRGTYRLADFTFLPQKGTWRQFLTGHPAALRWLARQKQKREAHKRMEQGFPVGPEDEPEPQRPAPLTIDQLAKDADPTDTELFRQLVLKMREVESDLRAHSKKRYTYEEWVELTRLIRFTATKPEGRRQEEDGEEEGLVEWDWIGEDSPMMTRNSEAEFVLDRLWESLQRYVKRSTVKLDELDDRNSEEDVVSRRRRTGEDDGD
jgi:potassium channel subfamily K